MKRNSIDLICVIGFLVGLQFLLPYTIFAADTSISMTQGSALTTPAIPDADVLRDPAAIAELKRARDFLMSLPRFHIKASVTYDVIQKDGRPLEFEKIGDVYLQRPDRFFAEMHFDDGRLRQLCYDGNMLILAERSKNLYTRLKAPPTVDETLDMLEGVFNDPQALSDLYYSDLSPLDHLALEADVVGDSIVNGHLCTHLAFRGKTVDWQIWVEQGDTPFIRKLAISYREEPGKPQVVALLTLWETPEEFSDDLFSFTPPTGSQWIDLPAPMPRCVEEGNQP